MKVVLEHVQEQKKGIVDEPRQKYVMQKRYKYLLIYALVLALPLIIRACIASYGFSYLWENVSYYAIYLIIGLVSSFGKDRIRNLALLFQIGISVYWLLRILGSPLFHDVEILRFLSVLVFLFLFYCWYLSFKNIVSVWQIFIALLISVLFTLLTLLHGESWDFISFYTIHAETICENVLIILALILGVLLCIIKNRKQRFVAIILFIIISFLSSIYLSPAGINLLRYGSLSGRTAKPISLSFYNIDGNLHSEKYFEEKYSIVFIWDNTCRRHFRAMHDLERYYWKYKNNARVKLYVISMNQVGAEKMNLFTEYDSYHFNTPLYIAADSSMLCKELGVKCRGFEFVCLLRNDTLIYRNTMSNVGEYLDELIEKTP